MTAEQTEQKVVGKVLGQSGGNPVDDSKLYSFRIATPEGERRFGTFEDTIADELRLGRGGTYEIVWYEDSYTDKKTGQPRTSRKIITALSVEDSAFGAQPTSNLQPPQQTIGGRSVDQWHDIERASIERQVALKAAVKLFTAGTPNVEWSEEAVLGTMEKLYAALRNPPSETPGSPVAVSSRLEDSELPPSRGIVSQAAIDIVQAPTNFSEFWQAASKARPGKNAVKVTDDVVKVLGMGLQQYIGTDGAPASFRDAWQKCQNAWAMEQAEADFVRDNPPPEHAG